MNSRIKEVRKEAKLNQTEFGEKIGVKQGTVAAYECGVRVPLDTVVMSICKEFNVDEHWLRTGEGQMHVPRSRDEELAHEMGKLLANEDDTFRKRLISLCLQLDDQELELLKDFAVKIVEGKED